MIAPVRAQFMPVLVQRLMDRPEARPILRYKKDPRVEEGCVQPGYRNTSFPMVPLGGGRSDNATGDRSHSYKIFRPLSNAPSYGRGVAYLPDGLLIRQLRGETRKGAFYPDASEKDHCGSPHVRPFQGQVFTAGFWGLYMNYPSSDGYDLFWDAEAPYADVQQELQNALACGWVDEETRAVVVVFTLTVFTDMDRLRSDGEPPTGPRQDLGDGTSGPPRDDDAGNKYVDSVVDARSAFDAFGPNIDVSVKLIFEMPGNGLVRARHRFAVVDNTQRDQKIASLVSIICVVFAEVILYVTACCHVGPVVYFSKWTHAIQMISVALCSGGIMAFIWAEQRTAFDPLDPARAESDPAYGGYRCSHMYFVEENTEKTSTLVFLQLFSFHALLEVWRLLHYMAVFPKIMIPITALISSVREIGSFLMVFFIIVFGFSLCAHLTFGEVYEFRSITKAMITLVLVSVDELDSLDLFDGTQHQFYGQVFLYVFRMIASIIFLNIFIVIVLVQYEIARSEKREVMEHMHLVFLSQGTNAARAAGKVGKCCFCACRRTCPCCHAWAHIDEEHCMRRYRKWYHDFRSGDKEKYPPLRHDTEVMMGELHKLMKEVKVIRHTSVAQQTQIKNIASRMKTLKQKKSDAMAKVGLLAGMRRAHSKQDSAS